VLRCDVLSCCAVPVCCAVQCHFSIAQSSISEGALKRLGGTQVKQGTSSHASAASHQSSASRRKFLSSDEGSLPYWRSYLLTNLQMINWEVDVRKYSPTPTRDTQPRHTHNDCLREFTTVTHHGFILAMDHALFSISAIFSLFTLTVTWHIAAFTLRGISGLSASLHASSLHPWLSL
jgi:hypothetical protein